MNRKLQSRSCRSLALIAVSAILLESVVAEEADEDSGWITVEAPRVVRQEVGAKSDSTRLDLVSLTHRVNYTGLDLAMHADALELEKRIRESAQTGCEQLAALYPLANLDTPACVREALTGAMAQAQRLIAAAGQH